MSSATTVAATSPNRVDEVVGMLSARGGDQVRSRAQTDSRVVVTAAFSSVAVARAVAGELRTFGVAAVLGPESAGHEVAWRNRTAPSWFGAGACVCQPWSEFDRAGADLVIEIDPGRGFGSGTHPSTGLVLDQIAARVGAGASDVLDVGCGTGVLAVAAARLGAASVVAIDVDAAAIVATDANAALNGVDDVVEAGLTRLEALVEPFDLVVANIHAPVLVDLAPDLIRLTKPGGHLVLSGISGAQTSTVSAAMRPLEVVETSRRDDWVALVLTMTVRTASS